MEIFEEKIPGKRPRGRPRKECVDVETVFRKEWCRDRQRWMSFVTTQPRTNLEIGMNDERE